MPNRKHKTKVNKGEGWINVANNNNINLNDLLYWNGIDPLSKESLPSIHPGQEMYVRDPYKLDAATSMINDNENE